MDKVMEFNQTCERILQEIRVERLHKHGNFQQLVELAKEQSEAGDRLEAVKSLERALETSASNAQSERATYLIADNYLTLANEETNPEKALLMVEEASNWQTESESYHEEPEEVVVQEKADIAVLQNQNIEQFNEVAEPTYQPKPTFLEKLVTKAAKDFYSLKFELQFGLLRACEARREAKRNRSLGRQAIFAY